MIAIRPMTLADYGAVLGLMRETPGLSVRDADSREAVERYLARNPGLSFVAPADGGLAGCIMCGHDGRRGYLQHLVVRPAYRRQGLGGALVRHCVEALATLGIAKCHVDVLKSNAQAARYWAGRGWTLRTDIDRYSYIHGGDANA
ncbi:MAG TPA: GNAT family N-acetyltransferase [Burkholderiales bacterium]|jgi:ribosomal protein S18 acetylase RimI-like enzyme